MAPARKKQRSSLSLPTIMYVHKFLPQKSHPQVYSTNRPNVNNLRTLNPTSPNSHPSKRCVSYQALLKNHLFNPIPSCPLSSNFRLPPTPPQRAVIVSNIQHPPSKTPSGEHPSRPPEPSAPLFSMGSDAKSPLHPSLRWSLIELWRRCSNRWIGRW